MKKLKTYIQPQCDVVRPTFILNQRWGDNEGFLGVSGKAIDAGLGESKGTNMPNGDESLWEE